MMNERQVEIKTSGAVALYTQLEMRKRREGEKTSQSTKKSDNDALNSKFAKSIRDFLRKVTLALDLKTKEAEELFSAATKKIEDSIKASNQFLNKEIEQSKQSILQLMQISQHQFDSHKNCMNQYNRNIESVKKQFNNKIRDCSEKTLIQLETIRSNYENNLDQVRDLKKLTTRALKECLNKKESIKNCVETENQTAHEKYSKLLDKLKSSSNDSIETIDQVLKSANICFKNAQIEVQKTIPGIIEKMSNCIKQSNQEGDKNLEKMESDKKVEKLKSITISIELPNEENEKMECLHEAQKDALNTVNVVLHEIESSEKFTETLKKSNKKNPHVQQVLYQTHKLFQEAKRVLQKCTDNNTNKNAEVDILECLSDIFDSIKLSKSEIIKKIETLRNDGKKSNLEFDKALEWISSAEEKLHKLKEIFQECKKSDKK
ncbi:uncharacterized protein PFB0765w-like [Leptopilina heterotoma]|uniref:uncharacterized protein PFB0765w-like n=1 Tax=Leptopilina heterotoma TaxID=63436 RepID=UPI001CA83125|nr:uncharacterized protein PFB0765w-like [Leptopilina heterotoma]